MNSSLQNDRRRFLRQSAWASTAVLVSGAVAQPPAWGFQEKKKDEKEDEGVAPAEDLMREHGALNRVMLIYEEIQRRLRAGKPDFDAAVLGSAAGIIRHFIEDYHEKLEENYLFPRFEKAGRLVDLVTTLRQQHAAGRKLTERTMALAVPATLRSEGQRRELDRELEQFIRMYRPHEAREDTILFPAFREIVSPHEYAALGEEFEDKEHELFGAEGFEGVVAQIGEMEKKLGIYELAQFTPCA